MDQFSPIIRETVPVFPGREVLPLRADAECSGIQATLAMILAARSAAMQPFEHLPQRLHFVLSTAMVSEIDMAPRGQFFSQILHLVHICTRRIAEETS
ncbi:MAG: hypothetical protein PHF94_02970, partial [Methanothrix sp.]|nr:hypothetical protein [Methanothrix sp.]